MKKNNNKKSRVLAALVVAAVLVGITACSKYIPNDKDDQNPGTTADKENNTASNEVRTIKIGTGSTFKPYAFIDENGELSGFEIDFLNEVDRRLEDYQFEYEAMDLTNLVLSLESGKLDLISYQLGKNAEREEKFVFPSNSYINSGVKVTVKTGNEEIKSLEDLKGKTLSMNPTEIANDIINRFNEENKDNPIEVVYRDGNTDGVVLVASGKVDACLAQPAQVIIKQQEAGMDAKTVGDLLEKIPVYQLFRKDDSLTDMMTAFDKAIKDMHDDGTLSELSVKWLEEDYTK